MRFAAMLVGQPVPHLPGLLQSASIFNHQRPQGDPYKLGLE